MRVWVVASFQVLQLKGLWAFLYTLFHGHVFISLGRRLRTRTAESQGGCLFNFARNYQAVFQNDHPILYSHQSEGGIFKITLWTVIKKMLNEICFIILRQYPALFQLAALQIWTWEWMMTTLRLAGWISKQESCQRFFCEGLPNAAKSSISSDPWIPKASWNSACS